MGSHPLRAAGGLLIYRMDIEYCTITLWLVIKFVTDKLINHVGITTLGKFRWLVMGKIAVSIFFPPTYCVAEIHPAATFHESV